MVLSVLHRPRRRRLMTPCNLFTALPDTLISNDKTPLLDASSASFTPCTCPSYCLLTDIIHHFILYYCEIGAVIATSTLKSEFSITSFASSSNLSTSMMKCADINAFGGVVSKRTSTCEQEGRYNQRVGLLHNATSQLTGSLTLMRLRTACSNIGLRWSPLAPKGDSSSTKASAIFGSSYGPTMIGVESCSTT